MALLYQPANHAEAGNYNEAKLLTISLDSNSSERVQKLSRVRSFRAVRVAAKHLAPACAVVVKLFRRAIKDEDDSLPSVTVKPAIIQKVCEDGSAACQHLFFVQPS